MSVFFIPDFHIINVGYNALNKSREDLFSIYSEMGFRPLLDDVVVLDNRKVRYFGKNTEILGEYVDKVIAAIDEKCAKDDFLFMDFPFAIKFVGFNKIVSYACSKGIKPIFFIHDLDGIRFQLPFVNMMDSACLDLCYCMISATDSMDECLIRQLKVSSSIKRVNYQYWDYLCLDELNRNENSTFCFAGNLAKSTFLSKLPSDMVKRGVNLYGKGMQKGYRGDFCGEYDSQKIVSVLDGKYGLVWDGKSAKTCTGNFGRYLKINASHKFGLYMACDKPVIVWNKSPIAKFVREKKIGFAVDSLYEIERILSVISEEDYQMMKRNILPIRKEVIVGDHLRRVIREALL